MDTIRRVTGWIESYARADDPLVSATNFIALVIVANQPFYPLYVWFFVGDDHGASLMTFLSTPFFLAVPVVARRSSLAGRAMLPIVGVLNTFFTAKVFGEASGVELFLCPCAMIAGMALRAEERRIMLAIIGSSLIGFLGLHGRFGAPMHLFVNAEYERFLSMNATSVGMLTALVALKYSAAYDRKAR